MFCGLHPWVHIYLLITLDLHQLFLEITNDTKYPIISRNHKWYKISLHISNFIVNTFGNDINKTMCSTLLLLTLFEVYFDFIYWHANALLLTYIFKDAKLVFMNPEVFVCHVVFLIMVMDASSNVTVFKRTAIMFMVVKTSLQVMLQVMFLMIKNIIDFTCAMCTIFPIDKVHPINAK